MPGFPNLNLNGIANGVAKSVVREGLKQITGGGNRDHPRAPASPHFNEPSQSSNLRPERPTWSQGESPAHYKQELSAYGQKLAKLEREPSFRAMLSNDPEARKHFNADKKFVETENQRVDKVAPPKATYR